MIANEASFIIITVLLVAALGWLVIHLAAGPDPPALPQLIVRRDCRRDDRLFQAKIWRKRKQNAAAKKQVAIYNRPADIALPVDRVADPPRTVQGLNGE